MLDKLIESKTSDGTNRRLSSLLLSTFTVVISALAIGLVYSLFSYNLAMATDNLEISTLLAPITDIDKTPPEAAPVQKQQSSKKTISNLPSRQDNIQRPEESPVNVPKTISVIPTTQQSRPNEAFTIGRDDVNPTGSETNGRSNGENTTGISNTPKQQPTLEKEDTVEPSIIKSTPRINPPLKNTVVSKGVINGQAKNLVKPAYPPPAKSVGASGEVKVQVTIDEEGQVISAVAISGHSLLKPAAVNAARLSTFTPTFLSNQKVKVTGIIIYNFTR